MSLWAIKNHDFILSTTLQIVQSDVTRSYTKPQYLHDKIDIKVWKEHTPARHLCVKAVLQIFWVISNFFLKIIQKAKSWPQFFIWMWNSPPPKKKGKKRDRNSFNCILSTFAAHNRWKPHKNWKGKDKREMYDPELMRLEEKCCF